VVGFNELAVLPLQHQKFAWIAVEVVIAFFAGLMPNHDHGCLGTVPVEVGSLLGKQRIRTGHQGTHILWYGRR
jgi:hypothetical protein